MKHKRLGFKAGKGGSTDWRHVFSTRRAQAAEMVIRPGDAEGGPDNRHQGADQWLFVISGAGEARINGRRTHLFTGSLLLIEQGDRHEIRNTGHELLRTLNFYTPPAFRADGARLPRGRKS